MATLTIRNFSCIDQAHLELQTLTVLIGPQASGKSIVSKLLFFLVDIMSVQFAAIEDKKSLEALKAEVVDEFKKYFPPSAWGKKRFRIRFVTGPYVVELARSLGRTWRSDEKVAVKFSKFFEQEYKASLASAKVGFERIRPRRGGEVDPSRELEMYYRVKSAAERRLKKALGREYVETQLFIPAGRSFFTSIGKAISAFDRGAILDPLTVRFGRYFATLRERGLRRYEKSFSRRLQLNGTALFEEFFGGRLLVTRGEEFIEASDGRKIPFGMLSSGQQELLPLVLALENYRFRERFRIFIEEPEAHLFPSAQSDLVDYLAKIARASSSRTMFITTHSPYVLTRLNILIKGGQIAKRNPFRTGVVEEILGGGPLIKPGSVAAYAIVNNKVESILGKDGLIDAEYLDEVSNSLSRQFNDLLEIEHRK